MGVALTLAAVALAVATATVAVRAEPAPVERGAADAGGPAPVEREGDDTGEPAPVEPEGTPEPGVPSVPELVSPAAEAVALKWEAPAGCPDAAAVRRALAGYLGEGVSVEAGAAVRAEARVTRGGGGYRLVLRTETASGASVRETTADDCTVIVDATAVIVAIAVDPSTVLGRGDAAPKPVEPEPEPEPTEPTPTEPTETTPAEPTEPAPAIDATPEPAPPPEPRVRYGLRIAGGIDLGVLPGLAGGLRLAGAIFGGLSGVGRLRRPRAFGRGWRAELRGDFWFPRTAIVEDGIGGRVRLWSLGARGCWVPRVQRASLEFPLCGGLESGAMRGDPVGDRIVDPTPSRRFWLAADGSAGLAWSPVRFLALVLQAELVVPIVRAGFRVGDAEIHRAGPVAGRALLGLEARFP